MGFYSQTRTADRCNFRNLDWLKECKRNQFCLSTSKNYWISSNKKKKHSILEPASKNSANSYLEYGKKCHRIINIPIMANVRTNCHTKNISISGNRRRSGESKSLERKNSSWKKIKTYIIFLQIRGECNEDKFQSIDHEVNLHFKKNLQPCILEKIIKLWNDDCLKEKTNSIERWTNSENWLLAFKRKLKEEFSGKNPFLK